MITFQNSKSFTIDNLRDKDKSVSTLLVPAHLIESLKQKQKDLGKNMTGYLRFLLKSYKTFTHSGMLPAPRKIKTEFQEEGLDLKRVSFRPHNVDWIELGELALAFGKSRCFEPHHSFHFGGFEYHRIRVEDGSFHDRLHGC